MTSEQVKSRIHSIDVMRGVVILLMLVDHVRERFFLHMQVSDPMVVESTSAVLFWSRFAAHFCAPAFIFLTGMSAWLYQYGSGSEQRSATSFLVKRGLFIIALEVVVINFSWMGAYHTLWLQVMWAIGLSMLALALLHKLPLRLLAGLGLTIVFAHNLLTPIEFSPEQWGYSFWTILHDRGYLLTDSWVNIKVSYPVLPWIGVILLGYCAGPLYATKVTASSRKQVLFGLAAICIGLFALLRGGNLYGETLPWQSYESVMMTWMSIFNITKYPPSLNFLLITLAGLFLGLALLERPLGKITSILRTFGSVPMFFYILHLYALLLLYTMAHAWVGNNKGDYVGVENMFWVWFISLALASILYWPVRWFSQYKRAHHQWWLKYL